MLGLGSGYRPYEFEGLGKDFEARRDIVEESNLKPEDLVGELLEKRKKEITENEIPNRRDPNRITRLTELKNLSEILELIYDVAKEQRRSAEKLEPEIQSTIVKQ